MEQSGNKGNALNYAYITVLTNERYIPGVRALKKALEKVRSCYDLVVLIPEDKAGALVEALEAEGVTGGKCRVLIKPPVKVDLDADYPFEDHYWNTTFFKIRATACTEFDKIVLLDSDMLILDNIDDLFSCPSYSAAVAGKSVHPEWEGFNSGLMVFVPDQRLFDKLAGCILPALKRRLAEGLASGDQDVFQEAFPDWKDIPELHLAEKNNMFFYELCDLRLAGREYGRDVRVVHFIGSWKPWDGGLLAKENAVTILRLLKHRLFRELSIYLKYYFISK